MKDRVPLYPGRVKLEPVAGQANTYDMTRADQPQQEGTKLNKANLLTDETVAKVWPNASERPADPTPNDAFDKIASTPAFKVGDMLQTVRTNPGDKWLLCDGSIYYDKTSGLYSALKYYTKPAPIGVLYTGYGTAKIIPLFNGDFFLSTAREAFSVFHTSTGETTEIAVPSDAGFISNVEWDGSKWVLCSKPSYNKISLYTSSDLHNWTLAKTHTIQDDLEFSDSYARTRFLFDGACFRLLCTRAGIQGGLLYDFSSDLQVAVAVTAINGPSAISRADDLVALSRKSDILLYNAGEDNLIKSIGTSNTNENAPYCIVKLSEDNYAFIPRKWPCTYVYRYKKSTKDVSSYNIATQAGLSTDYYTQRMLYDPNTSEYVFEVYYSSTYYEVRIHKDADWSVSSNYTKIAIDSNTYAGSYEDEPTEGWTYGGYTSIANGYSLLGGIKRLPECTDDVYYTYIKEKE